MLHFFQDLWEYPFLRNAVAAALLAAVAAGVTGSLVVVRRSTYLAGAVSHSVLAGLGFARLLERRFGIGWLPPMAGAVLAAVAAAVLLAWLTLRGRHRSDTVLSAVWTGGMALGVSFVAATPGYQDDLMSYLFGSILLLSGADLLWMLAADLVLLGVMIVCYNRFLAIAFNAELARMRGVATASACWGSRSAMGPVGRPAPRSWSSRFWSIGWSRCEKNFVPALDLLVNGWHNTVYLNELGQPVDRLREGDGNDYA